MNRYGLFVAAVYAVYCAGLLGATGAGVMTASEYAQFTLASIGVLVIALRVTGALE